jgi:hypothetical protein
LDGNALLAIAMRERDDAPPAPYAPPVADVVRVKEHYSIGECLTMRLDAVPLALAVTLDAPERGHTAIGSAHEAWPNRE